MLSAKAKARLAGAVSVTLFTVFAAGMTANSHKTREEKEREREALAERDRERAVLGAMIAPRFPPPVRSAQQEWTSVPHWGRGIYEGAISVSFPGGWVFPFGTNHLSSVEVMSCGAVVPDGATLVSAAGRNANKSCQAHHRARTAPGVIWRRKHRQIDRRRCSSFSGSNPLRWASIRVPP